ncbi:hypothetical protein A3K63_02105 [Candidatus Micrarchaeota archaeon RBG_16_49_10]|nr:MAG: hypothetical protein A3K63_02105 [Candidatus Micrarchaeota archaeon RBG_16_49_10]
MMVGGMFDFMYAKKEVESDRLADFLDLKTREELIGLLSKLLKESEMKSNNDKASKLRKEVDGFSFGTDYW